MEMGVLGTAGAKEYGSSNLGFFFFCIRKKAEGCCA